MAPFLIGPPQPKTTPPQNPPLTTTTTTTSSGNQFIDAMVANFNTISSKPPMGLTENFSATYLSSGNPCLDLFFHVVPDTPSDSLAQHLHLAWSHNPLTTLKLICNLRGVRGTGKSDKNGFYTAAFWLHKHHPKTLACNLPSFAEFGYFKDFPEILFRILGLTHPKKSRPQRKLPKSERHRNENAKTQSAKLRRDKRREMANTALGRYNLDPDYRFLHDRVADLFAGHLLSDMELSNSGLTNKLTLAAKWCPSLGSSFDRATLLCEAIARRVFPREKYSEYEGLEEAHYAFRVRDRLRKEVLVPLRRVLELPEVFMAAKRWNEVKYNRVASVAMKMYKDHFMDHDKDRFKEYLDNVKSGKAKIAAGALLPHELIHELKTVEDKSRDEVAELQWKRMVDDLSKEGKFDNCMAVCDVSGSMDGTPMEVCIALGLLLSEITEEPWKGKVITFSENPQLHVIEGDNLRSKTMFMTNMDWGYNTDFQKVFDLIIQVAVKGKVGKDQMIKRLFVFSDMEFDQASSNPWETDYEVIRRKYEENGYGDVVPEIVFWNLRNSRSTPVMKNQKGVALVSGFSKNMMKLFLAGKTDEFTPEAIMEDAISGDEYKKLVVLD